MNGEEREMQAKRFLLPVVVAVFVFAVVLLGASNNALAGNEVRLNLNCIPTDAAQGLVAEGRFREGREIRIEVLGTCTSPLSPLNLFDPSTCSLEGISGCQEIDGEVICDLAPPLMFTG